VKRIGIVVVHHSGRQHSENLISSVPIESSFKAILKTWIIDNSESETEREALYTLKKSTSTNLTIISVENKGYFSGANIGIKEALEWGATSVVVCNNDVIFDKDFFEILGETEYPSEVMMVYPELKCSKGLSQNPRNVYPVGLLRIICYYAYYRNYTISLIIKYLFGYIKKKNVNTLNDKIIEKFGVKEKREIVLGVGACFVLTPNYFKLFSNLPEDVFLFGEEALVADRISQHSGLILFDPSLNVRHEEHSTVGKMPSLKYWKIQKESSKIFLKSLFRLWWQNKIRRYRLIFRKFT